MKKTLLVLLKGMAMGTCDVIPGVSWWTIAFITGIYDRLIDALSSINQEFFSLLIRAKIAKARRHCDATFLLTLFAGIIVAILSFAKIIQFGLKTYPILVWWFFFGLILTSAIMLLQHIKRRKSSRIISIMVGIVIGYFVSTLPTTSSGVESLRAIGASGAIAIIAMILPGISGSYMLLVMGKYNTILSSLTGIIDNLKNMTLNAELMSSLITIVVFMCWCIIGLLLFSRLLQRVKTNYHDTMVAVLTWFMLWAMVKVWPWQKVMSTYQDRRGVEQTLQTVNILPTSAHDLRGWVLTIALWIAVVTAIHYLAKSPKTWKNQIM